MHTSNLKYRDETWDLQYADTNEKRAREVSAFYIHLRHSISSIAQVLSPRATVCYVVGNRRVKEVMLPTDEFIVDAFRQHGFTHKTTIVRNMPNKRMPKKKQPFQYCR